ncbi:MAG: hypothetical protein JJU11_06350 [Candidatus Sumerlaeia bacterium]|nr:hypothetical protein [Candidatus Sumerlaeia bacterium]
MNRPLLILAILFLLPVHLTASTTNDPRELELLRIYQQALEIFHPEALYLDFSIQDPAAARQILLEDMDDAPGRAERTGASSHEVDPEIIGALERLLVPLVWEMRALREALPPDDLLKRYMEANPSLFEQQEQVGGARLLVEHGVADEAVLAGIEEELNAMEESGETFRDVARRFYRSQGVDTDGYFGWRGRDRLREDLFDVFSNADPDDPWFGPVETTHGFMYGVLYGVRPEGMPDFDDVRQRVVQMWLREHFADWREDQLSLEEEERGLVRHWPPGGLEEVPDPEDPAFELEGRVYTWEDVRQWTPGVHGDDSRPEFYSSLGRRAVQNFLVYTGSRAREVRSSQDYKRLYDAVIAHWQMARAMSAELAAITSPPDAIERFYTENLDELYTLPPTYRAVVWRFAMNPEGHRNPAFVNESRRDAWQRANRTHALLKESDSPEDVTLDEDELGPFRLHAPEGFHSTNSMPHPLGQWVHEEMPAPGDLSPVKIGREDYHFALILEVREGEPRPFDTIIDQIWADWRAAEQDKVREKYRLNPGDEGAE